jgi:hypothetical protein
VKRPPKGPAAACYEIQRDSPATFPTFLSRLLLREFKEVAKACLKAGVTREHLSTMLAEAARGGRK